MIRIVIRYHDRRPGQINSDERIARVMSTTAMMIDFQCQRHLRRLVREHFNQRSGKAFTHQTGRNRVQARKHGIKTESTLFACINLCHKTMRMHRISQLGKHDVRTGRCFTFCRQNHSGNCSGIFQRWTENKRHLNGAAVRRNKDHSKSGKMAFQFRARLPVPRRDILEGEIAFGIRGRYQGIIAHIPEHGNRGSGSTSTIRTE